MKNWKVILIQIPSILLQSSYAYASIEQHQQGRKHSTAHYCPNNDTVYILGGIEFDLINATQSQFASSVLSLRFDKKDFSLHSTAAATYRENLSMLLPPTIGHTSHLHVPSNSIISVFGMQQQDKESPPLIPSPSSTSVMQQNMIPSTKIPASRFKHTSVLINKNKLYVIGGRHANKTRQFIEPHDMVWSYSFSTQTWKHLRTTTTSSISSMAGHTTVVYEQWLISCFGQQEQELSNSCTWFDTITLNSTKITPVTGGSSIGEWPAARTYASMISLPNNRNEYVLFGGETEEKEILDDLWKLHVDSAFTMTWQKIQYKNLENTNFKRSGHASTLIGDVNVVLYYGGQSGSQSVVTDPIYLDLSKMEWVHTKNMNSDNGSRIIRQYGVDVGNINTATNSHLSAGAIAGIIVSVICMIALGFGLFAWKKHQQRQQNIHQKSRAARFSRSSSPMQSIALKQQQQQQQRQRHSDEEKMQQNNSGFPGGYSRTGLENSTFLSLPELALSRHRNSSSRISAISLGAEFSYFADDYYRHSHNNNSAIPKIELISSNNQGETKSNNSGNKSFNQQLESLSEEDNHNTRRESTGFKRLTLNFFSGTPSQQQDDGSRKKKDRSSSLFQLRASRLLQPGTPITPGTPDGRFPLSPKGNGLQPRFSLGAKSVASVQWVGFNDNMDYKESNWRDSSASSMHLAVKNHRSSSYYTNDSAQSTPRSPMFPNHLHDSTARYQLNQNEANSWKLELTK